MFGGILVGEILKKAREESGKDLKEISKILKIRYDYLHAIEEGDFKLLPEEVYIKGYIREYAELLNIDPEVALQAYIQQKTPLKDKKTEIPAELPYNNKKFKTKYVIILLLLIVVGLILIFILSSSKKESDQTQISVKNENLIFPPKIEPSEDITLPLESKTESSQAWQIEDTIENEAISKKTGEENTLETIHRHTLKVTATDTVWLLVTIDKAEKEEMLLKPEETVTFQAKEDFSLKIGNAGGVKIVFDGKKLGKLGKQGQVINLTLPEKN